MMPLRSCSLRLESYATQRSRWPDRGRHVVAQYDRDSVVVYQAFRPSIASFAATHGHFGGDFGYGRMSWIKPGFLWMMYRCGWATKESQERVLAVRIQRSAFETILAAAVPSSFDRAVFESDEQWREAVAKSSVRLQWDPDHDPYGQPVERRAIQIGLRGEMLASYGRDWVLSIEDITDYVHEQRASRDRGLESLMMPREEVYAIGASEVRARLRVDDVAG